MKTRVFGIGFHKTGTTSLAKALSYLGYRVTGPNGVNNPNIAKDVYEMSFNLANKFDAFQDNPWPILYKEFDHRFPGSKFILTVRPVGDWIESVANHFGEDETPMREWIYGIGHPKGNEAVYIERYERHNREVVEHFKNRENDLLILDITGGEGWEKLCSFLGEEIPGVPFPRANTALDRENERKRERNWFWQTYLKLERHTRRLVRSRLNGSA